MSETNEFLIRNPEAPFILLQRMLDNTNIQQNKRGDVKWIYSNIDKIFSIKKDKELARKLLMNVMFIEEVKQ
jgi:hypothetical protein